MKTMSDGFPAAFFYFAYKMNRGGIFFVAFLLYGKNEQGRRISSSFFFIERSK